MHILISEMHKWILTPPKCARDAIFALAEMHILWICTTHILSNLLCCETTYFRKYKPSNIVRQTLLSLSPREV